MSDVPTLINSLQNPSVYSYPVDSVDLIETHISWVLLTGDFAYKIKKSVRFDFVDFSTLERRETFCRKELELNRRLAPDLYQRVVPITGSENEPVLDGSSKPIEYAVKMREFPQTNLFSARVENDELEAHTIDDLARKVSDFHATIQNEPPSEEYGSPDLVRDNFRENFEAIDASHLDEESRRTLKWVRNWSRERFEELEQRIVLRRRNGSVRNCHGDMHLRNIVWFNDEINIFDCIEFNKSFRWIDVMDEVAFLTMDLVERGHPDLANRFVDRYLTHSNQYEGLALLNFYRTYRAMVRCKVSYLQSEPEENDGDLPSDFYDYLRTARNFTESPDPVLLITHGVSGTGKTSVTQELLETLGAIRLRSDIERKRIAGIDFTRDANEESDQDLYSETMTERTYDVLLTKAETVLKAGFPVIIDATFLKRPYRKDARNLAEQLEVPFRIIHTSCEEETLRERLRRRKKEEESVSDAGTDVLDHQLRIRDTLTSTERAECIEVKTDQDGLTQDKLVTIQALT